MTHGGGILIIKQAGVGMVPLTGQSHHEPARRVHLLTSRQHLRHEC